MFSSLALVLSILSAAAAGVGLYSVLDEAHAAITTALLLGGSGAIFVPAAALALAAIVLAAIGTHLSAKLLGTLAMVISVLVLVASIVLFFVYDGTVFFQYPGDFGDKLQHIWEVFKAVFQSGVKEELMPSMNQLINQ